MNDDLPRRSTVESYGWTLPWIGVMELLMFACGVIVGVLAVEDFWAGVLCCALFGLLTLPLIFHERLSR
jgi:hypothetical protein